MDSALLDLLQRLIAIFDQGGAWAVVVFMGWAYHRKEQECQSLYKMLYAATNKQNSTLLKVSEIIGAVQRSKSTTDDMLTARQRDIHDNEDKTP